MNALALVIIAAAQQLLFAVPAAAATNATYNEISGGAMRGSDHPVAAVEKQWYLLLRQAVRTNSSELDVQGNWGAVSNGLQVSIRFATNIYAPGEPVLCCVLLRNTTTNTLVLIRATWFCAQFDVLDSQQQAVPEVASINSFISGAPDISLAGLTQVNHMYDLSQLYSLTAGAYHVSVRFQPLRWGDFNTPLDVRSGTASFVVLPAPPQPKLISTILVAEHFATAQTNEHRWITVPWGSPGIFQETIVNSEPESSILASEDDRVALIVSGQRTNLPAAGVNEIKLLVNGVPISIPVMLAGLHHDARMRSGTNEWNVFGYFELQIHSKTPGLFTWSSWHREPPYRFQIFTAESATSYACAILRGVQLWRLTESRPPELMREIHVKMKPHPDALPVLPAALIEQAVGRTNLIYSGTLSGIVVDHVSDKSGTLQVTLHGVKGQPKATFELRDGKWVRTGSLHNNDNPPPAH